VKTTLYEVFQRGTQWWITRETWEDGPFGSKQAAVDCAISLARAARAKGCPANVTVRHAPDYGSAASSPSSGSRGNVMIWTLGGGGVG